MLQVHWTILRTVQRDVIATPESRHDRACVRKQRRCFCTRYWAHSQRPIACSLVPCADVHSSPCCLTATRNIGGACIACNSLLRRLSTHSRNTKLRVLSTDVVIRPITKACLPCPGSSSRHRQRQRTSPLMAQDADNRCHTFETLEITTSEDTRKREQGIKFATCSHDVSSNGICITLDPSRHCFSQNAFQCAPTTDNVSHLTNAAFANDW